MIDLEQEVEINLFSQNIQYYKNKGYDTDQYLRNYINPKTGKIACKKNIPWGTTITVKLYDVNPHSNIKIPIVCDYCGKKYSIVYNSYTSRKKNCNISKDACEKCKIKKQREVILLKYGVDNGAKLDFVKEKMKNTNLERYGSVAPAGNIEVYQKMKNTMLDKYGVENSMQHPDIQVIARKNRSKTLSKNGTIPTSNQQIYLFNLLGGELNYPISQFLADIKLNNDILIEYNGGGHRLAVILGGCTDIQFDRKEKAKQHYFKDNGFNLITIESRRDYLPSDEIILNMIEYSKEIFSQGRSWIVFDVDDGIVKYRYNTKHYDYGDLRKISAEDLKSA
jgi:hypothetical protein